MEDERPQVIEWAQGILNNHQGDAVIIDTETTGLGEEDQIVQIGIIDLAGNVLLDALIKPTIPIPPAAIAVHHIDDIAVARALPYTALHPAINRLLRNAYVITYNAVYDKRMLEQTQRAHGYGVADNIQAKIWDCAMLAYARFWGDYNDYRGSYRWQKLTIACEQQGIQVVGAHGAVGDCRMTLALIKRLAEARVEAEDFVPTPPDEIECFEDEAIIFEDGADQWAIDPDEGDR